MGQKVHPIGFRLGIVKESQARWYANKKSFTVYLHEDLRVRRMIMTRLADAGVSKVEIERSANQMTVTIHAAKPGIVIGKSGVKVEELRKNLESMTSKKVRVTIQEIRQPELDAYLVACSVAEQLEKRVAFRRAIKQAVGRGMRLGAKGIRVQVSGRLGGAEMSRRESDRQGRVPLHTLRADIDFGIAAAHTTFGAIGVKVWVYKGEILPAGREPAAGTVAGRPGARPLGRPPTRPTDEEPVEPAMSVESPATAEVGVETLVPPASAASEAGDATAQAAVAEHAASAPATPAETPAEAGVAGAGPAVDLAEPEIGEAEKPAKPRRATRSKAVTPTAAEESPANTAPEAAEPPARKPRAPRTTKTATSKKVAAKDESPAASDESGEA